MSNKNRKSHRKWWLIAIGAVLLCAASAVWNRYPPATWGEPPSTRERGVLTVRFLDVGQGDCALLTVDDTAVLVDAGPTETPTLARDLLEAYGITRLDGVIFSHPHADHIGGAPALLQAVSVDTVWMPEQTVSGAFYDQTMAAIAAQSICRKTPRAGDTFAVGALRFAVLGPLDTAAEDENDLSLCVRVDYGARSFLFCGDMTEKAEQTLLQLDTGLHADVLKVAHHGSGASSSREFLEAVSPQTAVVSCGRYNDYGHPHSSALTRLAAVGATVYRTDTQGTVTVTTDGDTLSVFCEKRE